MLRLDLSLGRQDLIAFGGLLFLALILCKGRFLSAAALILALQLLVAQQAVGSISQQVQTQVYAVAYTIAAACNTP